MIAKAVPVLLSGLIAQSLGGIAHHQHHHNKPHGHKHHGYPTAAAPVAQVAPPTAAPPLVVPEVPAIPVSTGYGSPAALPLDTGYGAPHAIPLDTGYGAPHAKPVDTGYGAPLAPPLTVLPQPEPIPEPPVVIAPFPEIELEPLPDFDLEPTPVTDLNLAHPAPPVVGPVDFRTIRTNAMNPRFSTPYAPAGQNQFHAQDGFGGFVYGYENENSAQGEVRGDDGVTRGYYSYVDPYGQYQQVEYLADALNGFQVSGTNIPVAEEYVLLDTPEVLAARAAFQKAYDEALARSG